MGAIRYVEAILSLDTSAYTNGDVLAATQEVPLCLRAGVSAELVSLVVLDKDDQNQDMDIVLLRSNASIGTENAAVNVTDANADEILGIVSVDASADNKDLVNSRIAAKTDIGLVLSGANAAATSLYVAAICRGGTPTHTAAGITLKLGLRDG